jgi:uncharacterized integral membrane protein
MDARVYVVLVLVALLSLERLTRGEFDWFSGRPPSPFFVIVFTPLVLCGFVWQLFGVAVCAWVFAQWPFDIGALWKIPGPLHVMLYLTCITGAVHSAAVLVFAVTNLRRRYRV